MNIWYTFVTLACVVLLVGFVLRRYGLKGLTYERLFDRRTYFAGEQASMIEIVRNDRPMLLPWLRIESRIPASFRFRSQQNLDISGNMYHRSIFFMMPYQQVTRRHSVTLLHRGDFNLGNATMTAGDLIGMAQTHREVRLSIPVLVYPRLLNEEDMPPAFTQMLGECIAQHSLMTDPFMISGIREYRSGDNVRDIHWPASARMQELQVRTHDHVSQTRLLVLINCQLREDQWDGAMTEDQPVIEYEISMAATMCLMLLRQGLQAGFGCNMPVEETRSNTLLLPSAGAARQEELLTAMARLRPVMTRSFISFLQELPVNGGMDVLILSPYDSDAIRNQMDRLRKMGCGTRLIVISQQEVTGAA